MRNCGDILIFVLDNILVSIIIGPFVVMYWRGTWVIYGAYVFPDNLAVSGWTAVVIGNMGLVTATLLQWPLKRSLSPNKTLTWIFGYHLYIYVFGFASVCHWYGAWTLIDVYLGKDSTQNGVVVAITGSFLMSLRCFKTLVAPPIVVAVDTDDIFFGHTTRFRTTPQNKEHYFWDAVLTVVFIGNLIAAFWHSTRVLLDNFVHPGDNIKSCWTTVCFSYVGLLLCCPLQFYGNKLFRKAKRLKTRIAAVVIEDVVFAVGAFSSISHWKAFWMLWEIYILPDNAVASGWICHAVGLTVLMLLLSGESVIVRGCFLDGDDDLDNGCVFPNNYVRYFINKFQEKKGNIPTRPPTPVRTADSQNGSTVKESRKPRLQIILDEGHKSRIKDRNRAETRNGTASLIEGEPSTSGKP